jgi:D-alanine-D-alanine ligase-like ATP-grasp enzyme
METNDLFDRPSNWDEIVSHSVNALKAVGLDVGAVDLRVQSSTNSDGESRVNPKFIVIEINSAPSFGKVTEEKYIEQLPKILNRKYND